MKLNPFGFLFESKTYPYARIFRTSFYHKIKDCYKIIASSIEDIESSSFRFGLFDYLTLGTLYVLYFLPITLMKAMNTERENRRDRGRFKDSAFFRNLGMYDYVDFIGLPIQALIEMMAGIITLLPRMIAGFIGTIAALPIIAVAHFCSYIFSYRSKKEAFLLESEQSGFALTTYLEKDGFVFDALPEYEISERHNSKVYESTLKKNNQGYMLTFFSPYGRYGSPRREFSVNITNNNAAQVEKLAEINFAQLAKYVDDDREFSNYIGITTS